MEDFIVRIYRRKEENGGLFGVVEEVGVAGRKAFRSMGELMRILRRDAAGESRAAEGIPIALPVTVKGKDAAGRPFSEETVIEALSPSGAGFRLKTPVLEGDELQLWIEPACCSREKGARVANVARGRSPRMVGVIFA